MYFQSIVPAQSQYQNMQLISASPQSSHKYSPKYTPLNFPKVRCLFHPEYHVNNFCKFLSCLMPLCPECVLRHDREHLQFIETLDVSLNEVYYGIMQRANDRIPNAYSHNQEIEFAKKQLHTMIDEYFNGLQSNLLPGSKGSHSSHASPKEIQQRVQNLDNPQHCLQELIYFNQEEREHLMYTNPADHQLKLNYEALDAIKYNINNLFNLEYLEDRRQRNSGSRIIQVPVPIERYVEVEKIVPVPFESYYQPAPAPIVPVPVQSYYQPQSTSPQQFVTLQTQYQNSQPQQPQTFVPHQQIYQQSPIILQAQPSQPMVASVITKPFSQLIPMQQSIFQGSSQKKQNEQSFTVQRPQQNSQNQQNQQNDEKRQKKRKDTSPFRKVFD